MLFSALDCCERDDDDMTHGGSMGRMVYDLYLPKNDVG